MYNYYITSSIYVYMYMYMHVYKHLEEQGTEVVTPIKKAICSVQIIRTSHDINKNDVTICLMVSNGFENSVAINRLVIIYIFPIKQIL
jgi:hypothetical protein